MEQKNLTGVLREYGFEEFSRCDTRLRLSGDVRRLSRWMLEADGLRVTVEVEAVNEEPERGTLYTNSCRRACCGIKTEADLLAAGQYHNVELTKENGHTHKNLLS